MTSRWIKTLFAVMLVYAAAAPAAAQEAMSIPAGQAWTHRHSGITVPATLGGVARGGATSFAEDELDVGLQFDNGDVSEALSFYIFRNTNGGLPIWFAQAQWAIENRANFGKSALAIPPQAFTPPGQSAASGLRAVYRPGGTSGYRSSGVAMLSVGDWYVKMRASSKTRSPADLAAWMDAALAQIRWPGDAAAAAVFPVSPCETPLSFAEPSRDAPKDGAAALLNSMLGTISPAGAPSTAVLWCRDQSLGDNQTVYRPDSATDRYVIALGDNGIGVSIGPDPAAGLLETASAAKPAPPRFTVVWHRPAEQVNFVTQDRLPSPQRVVDLFNANRRTSTVPTWGDKRMIEINRDAM